MPAGFFENLVQIYTGIKNARNPADLQIQFRIRVRVRARCLPHSGGQRNHQCRFIDHRSHRRLGLDTAASIRKTNQLQAGIELQ